MKKFSLLIVLFLVSIMTSCSYGATLYLVGGKDLKSYESGDFIKKVKDFFNKNMDKKYFTSVKYLNEEEEAPNFSEGDYYVFLFGWTNSDQSTVFFRPDGRFREYADLNKIKNPSIVVFIPLTEERRTQILKRMYLELLEDRWGFNYTDSHDGSNRGDIEHCYLIPVTEKIDFSDIKNFSHILDWVKVAKDDIQKKIKEKKERELKKKEKEERLKKEREEYKRKKEEEERLKKEKKPEKEKNNYPLDSFKDFLEALNKGESSNASYVKNNFTNNISMWMADESVREYFNGIHTAETKAAFDKIPKNILEETTIAVIKHLLEMPRLPRANRSDALYYVINFMKKLDFLPAYSKLQWLYDENADWMESKKNEYRFGDLDNDDDDLSGWPLKKFLEKFKIEHEKKEKEYLKKEKKSSQEKGFVVDRFASALQSIR